MNDILILSVGGSSKPLIDSINHYNPSKVFFMVSEQSWTEAGQILEKTNFSKIDAKIEVINDYENILDCFLTAESLIKKAKNIENPNIIVDFTGGTKTMSVGLYIAALNEGCEFTYTGSNSPENRQDDGLGKVKDSFELIKRQHNPYEFFAIAETSKGIEFFNKYQFDSAYRNFKEAYDKTNDKILKKKFSVYCKLIKTYSQWDKLDDGNGNQRIDTSLGKLKSQMTTLKDLTDIEFDFLNKMDENINFLSKKFENKPSKSIKYYLADLINNSKRRIEEGKFDDAVARLYRIFELIAQIRLSELGLMSKKKLDKEKKFFISKANILNQLEKVLVDQIIDKYGKDDEIKVSGLYQTYDLLNILNEDVGKEFLKEYNKEDSNLRSQLSVRNNSILAHGLNPVSEKISISLFKQAIDFTMIIFPDIEKYLEMSEFPKLSKV